MRLDSADVAFVAQLVGQRAAIRLDASKAYLVESRLHGLAIELGLPSEAELVMRLRRPGSTELRDRVVDAMTTNETLFFRDGHPFEALRTNILPELLKSRGARPLHLWSAACSTGQEPYSLAMLVRDHFPELAREELRIIASDLSQRVLEQARAGRYNTAELGRGLPPALRLKHFREDQGGWVLDPRVRQLVEFKRINLVEAWPFTTPMDVVLMLYVLVYFDGPTRLALLDRVRRALRPGGWLMLGGAEVLDAEVTGFERVAIGRTLAYRRR
jgi:chemotaxis protein methyltransferase CheR